MLRLFKATFVALIVLFPWPGGTVYAVAPVPTEFPVAKDFQPSANMPDEAKKRWEERKLRRVGPMTRANPSIIVNDFGALPVFQRSFKPLQERVAQLAQAHNNLPARLRSSWIDPADVSKGPLNRCALQVETPVGVEVDARLTGLMRVYQCPGVGSVILSEMLLRKGGMVNLLSAGQVNMRMSAGGHLRALWRPAWSGPRMVRK